MQSIPLENGPVQITGAYDFDRRESGIRPRRLPDWTRIQVQEFTEAMVTMGSGIRLEFVTDSDCIQLEVMQTRLDLGGVPNAVYDLEIDQGEPVSVQAEGGNLVVMDIKSPAGFRLQHGEASTVVFKDLGNQMKQCALWIPANAQVELRSLNISNGASISAVPESDRPKWVHHGSSISHCMEASQPTGTWPVVAARLANVNVINLGLGGACHLDQYVARTMRDTPTDFLSLKAGINIVNGDTLRERTFAPALHGFIDTIREGQPDTPFLIISPIYCPPHEKIPGPTLPGKNRKAGSKTGFDEIRAGSLTLERVRAIISDVVNARQAAGDSNLYYLDGLELFGEADTADLPDDLHPNAAGYARMGSRFNGKVFGAGGIFNQDC